MIDLGRAPFYVLLDKILSLLGRTSGKPRICNSCIILKEGAEGEESAGTDGEEPLQGTEDGASQDGDEASETQEAEEASPEAEEGTEAEKEESGEQPDDKEGAGEEEEKGVLDCG